MNLQLVAIIVVLAGLALLVFGHSALPRLPEDLIFRGGGSTLFIPIGACIVISIVFSILLSLFGRR